MNKIKAIQIIGLIGFIFSVIAVFGPYGREYDIGVVDANEKPQNDYHPGYLNFKNIIIEKEKLYIVFAIIFFSIYSLSFFVKPKKRKNTEPED